MFVFHRCMSYFYRFVNGDAGDFVQTYSGPIEFDPQAGTTSMLSQHQGSAATSDDWGLGFVNSVSATDFAFAVEGTCEACSEYMTVNSRGN